MVGGRRRKGPESGGERRGEVEAGEREEVRGEEERIEGVVNSFWWEREREREKEREREGRGKR